MSTNYGNARYIGDAKTKKVRYQFAERTTIIELTPEHSLTLFNHSPDGFNWGYTGSGPAQLALAILSDCMDDEVAIRLYQKFKREVVATWQTDRDFEVALVDIYKWIDNELDNQNENLASTAPIP